MEPTGVPLLDETFITTSSILYTSKQSDETPTTIALYVVNIVLYVLTAVLIFTLNPLCLIVLRRVANFQTPTKIFLATLTVNDIVCGLAVVMPQLVRYVVPWSFGQFVCILQEIVRTWVFHMGVYSLLLLAVDRYFAIRWGLHYHRLITVTRAIALVVIGLILSIGYCMPYLVVFYPNQDENPTEKSCRHLKYPDVSIYIPFGLILVEGTCVSVMYIHILIIARRQARRIAQENQPNAPQRISTKSLTTVLTVMTAMLAGSSSRGVSALLTHYGVNINQDVLMIVELLCYTSSWLNVVIYYWRNNDFRVELKRIISALFREFPRWG